MLRTRMTLKELAGRVVTSSNARAATMETDLREALTTEAAKTEATATTDQTTDVVAISEGVIISDAIVRRGTSEPLIREEVETTSKPIDLEATEAEPPKREDSTTTEEAI